MKTRTTVISLIQAMATEAVVAVTAPAHAQWVMAARHIAGRINEMTQDDQTGKPAYQFATVILDAPANNVFAAVINVVSSNRAVTIVSRDDAALRLKVAEGSKNASLNVIALSDDTSELLIAGTAASSPSDPSVSRVVAAILRVCADMHKTCSVGAQ